MLASTTLELLALLGFAGILIAAAFSDVRRLIVPNRYCAAIVLLYPVHALAAPGVDWLGALAVAGACLGVGFVLFSLRVFGGGDAKLFTAASLWAGPGLFPELLMGTAVAGGLLAVAYLVQRRLAGGLATASQGGSVGPASPMQSDATDAAATRGRWQRQLPYGVAVAAGGLLTALMLFLGR